MAREGETTHERNTTVIAIRVGICMLGSCMLALFYVDMINLYTLFLPVALFFFGVVLVGPNCYALTLGPFLRNQVEPLQLVSSSLLFQLSSVLWRNLFIGKSPSNCPLSSQA